MRTSRRGFTMVEMMTVIVFMAILASIALLKYIDLRNTARTASLAGDVRAVTIAVFNYYGEHDDWPPETSAGIVPTGLAPFLPGDLAQTFDRTYYVLDYDNIGTSVPSSPLIGVGVTSSDPQLMAKLIQSFSTKYPFFMNNGKLTFLIAGM
jgi:prepilin-type N-terminal cleavage/methylation domain-containing protein